MARIYVTGEALIDFVPANSDMGPAFAPRCGGSNFNAAKAAARQGADVEFIGPLSTDMFGDQLKADIEGSGVGTALMPRQDRPTTLAFVQFIGNDARYAFNNEMTATQLADYNGLGIAPKAGDILHVGSISLIDEPGGANTEAFALAQSQDVLLTLDPNARPDMIGDVGSWRARIRALMDAAAIVKLSDEDLEIFAPGADPSEFVSGLVADGVALAVVTLGPDGAVAATRNGTTRVAGRSGKLVDTVGAGDTVTGTLLASCVGKSRAEIAEMDRDRLAALLNRAMAAAWLNCQHSGANPPDIAALDAFLAG